MASDNPEASLPWASAVVLAEQLNLSLGPDLMQALDTVQAGIVRPGLDPELQDLDGMPVFAARHHQLVLADVDGEPGGESDGEADTAYKPGASGGLSSTPDAASWPPEVARTLALLKPVLHDALASLAEHAGPESPGWLAWQQRARQAGASSPLAALQGAPQGAVHAVNATRSASASGSAPLASAPDADQALHLSGVARPEPPSAQLARKAQAPLLHLRLVLPPNWSFAQREQAVAWVKAQCGVLLDWSEAMSARGINWLVEPLMQNEDLWAEVDQTLVRWHREGRPELLLILAADTAITPQVVARMQARGELFTPQHQVGRMPGEAAAGLLLGTAHWLGLPVGAPMPMAAPAAGVDDGQEGQAGEHGAHVTAASPQAAVRLWRPLRGRRDKSADAHGRLGVQALAGALQQVQVQHQSKAETLRVMSDADHRPSRAAELFESVAAVSPGVDPMLAIARVGQACGDLGVAGALVPSVLASAWLRASGAAASAEAPPDAAPDSMPLALAVLLQSSHERVVVPFAPWSRVLKAAEPQAQAAA